MKRPSVIAKAKPVVVINERDAPVPIPQDQIERVRGGTAGVAWNNDSSIALRDRGHRQVLRQDRLACEHPVPPRRVGELLRCDAEGLQCSRVPAIEQRSDVGLIGNERGGLECANLIGLSQRGLRGKGCIKRYAPDPIEPSAKPGGPLP